MQATIEVNGVRKRFGPTLALDGISFSVESGQVTGFVGPNGAGKSTTMRILTGYLSASSGSASVAGFDVFKQSVEVRRRVGYLPELNPLYTEMRVEPFLHLMCRLRGVEPRRRARQIDSAIEACGLAARRRDIIGRLSKGLRQRVGLAQAVVHDPDVLILDEPTAGLDPRQTRETRDLIKDLGRRHTVILSSHILSEVQATCERVVIIDQGSLVADDTPKGLSQRLGGARTEQVEVIVRGSEDEIRQCLEAVESVTDVRLVDAGDGEWQAIVSGQSKDLQDEVARAVVTKGLRLRELKARTLSLEDVFLKLTDEAKRG
jgi:ABC-2 type transport system ATP-binding protein